MTTPRIFDDTKCELGEGPLWHPLRGELLWFDIVGKRLFAKGDGETVTWQFDEHVSAAGWIDKDTILVASETSLSKFNLETGESEFICALESDNPTTRSNDGRADPKGGFWIGTMGFDCEPGAGAIYRYFQGELRKLYDNITVSNAICFAPNENVAYFSDTAEKVIWKVKLDEDGWPIEKRQIHVDVRDAGINPDGAVTDSEGCVWNAQWGNAAAARFGLDGREIESIAFNAAQTTCPAIGGNDFKTMYMTSAALSQDGADDGKTFAVEISVAGQAEPAVIL